MSKDLDENLEVMGDLIVQCFALGATENELKSHIHKMWLIHSGLYLITEEKLLELAQSFFPSRDWKIRKRKSGNRAVWRVSDSVSLQVLTGGNCSIYTPNGYDRSWGCYGTYKIQTEKLKKQSRFDVVNRLRDIYTNPYSTITTDSIYEAVIILDRLL